MSEESERPVSPHLQVYRWQITMASSILHRFSGVALAVGTLVLLYWLIALAAGPQAFATAQAVVGSWLGLLLLFGWTVALVYHFLNGIRHLVWDAGFGLELGTAQQSGMAVFILTGVLTVLIWAVGLVIA